MMQQVHDSATDRNTWSSSKFKGKTTLMRHRLVNGELKEEIAKVHAWTQKCYTEEEWEKKAATA
jgi:stress-induced morphogen